MIYASSGAGGSTASRRVGKSSSPGERKGVARKSGKGGGGKPQQVVQWKQKNVEEGIVVVDEQQLSKLIKREPIEKYYKLDPEPFASGLFASVRRCVSLDTGEVYAAKFSSRARYGEDCSPEIHHEIALLSLCAPSPRIVTLHDVFETPTEVIILMQFAPGGDLQTVIDENQVPFETDVVNFIRQLVEGLAYLHERKIAHLDIKPQNLVMMGDFPNCDIKLCDFEISRVILEGTEIREILGTPDYVAPEILHYEPITLAADLWSLGVTTYVLLSGFSPFGGETDQETFCNISRAQLDFPEELFEDISQDAKDFIQQLLVRDPSARPTAKNLLHHRWLANQKTPRRRIGSTDNMKVSISDTNGKSHTMSEKNLRKYLSKSREALFERVIQQQNQYKNDLRKTTLLSQYNKTRMCESHMSLVSKTREERPLISLSPSFSRSREKLYGLRSLSRSHEGLDLLKLSGQRGETQGTSKTYTRATTADLSMLPLLRLKEHLNESDDSISTSTPNTDDEMPKNGKPDTSDTMLKDETTSKECPTSDPRTNGTLLPKEKIFRKNNSESCITISSLISPTLLKNTLVNCAMLTHTAASSPDTSTGETSPERYNTLASQDSQVNEPKSNYEEPLASNISSKTLENKTETSIAPNTPTIQNGIEEESRECTEKVKLEKPSVEIPTENKEILKNDETPQEENATDMNTITDTDTADANTTDMNTTTDAQLIGLLKNNSDKEENKADEETENEPAFTVAQLISAYNRHQDIVTRTSLEVTMTSSDKANKLPPPYITQDPTAKFPTGPTALRLFIPDIDIETTTKKKNRTKSYRTLSKSLSEENKLQEDFDKSINRSSEALQTAVTNGSDTLQNLDQTNNNTDTCVCSFVLNPPIEEKSGVHDDLNKQPLPERNTNYLRSASLSSETSSGLTPSETLSSLSWEEVNIMPRTNGNDDTHWLNHKNTNHKPGNKNATTDGVNPWGKLCTGSYTRAMEKFGGKNETTTETATVTTARKCSLSMLFPAKQELDEKIRRKSTSVIKLS